MNVMTGKINIEEFFSEVDGYLKATDEYQNKVEFISSEKVNPEFLNIILESPVIIYVKKDTIPVNIELDNPIHFLKQIIYIEDIITLLYLYMELPQEIKIEKEFDCVFVESKISIKKIKPLKNVLFLDYFIKRNNNKVLKSGRLDYSKFESMAIKILTKNGAKSLIKKGTLVYLQFNYEYVQIV
jgi:hypothetical protein